MATIKGQNLRILQGFDADDLKCVAAATSCTVHISLSVEEDTTKDTVDDWITNIPSSINWDVEVSALVYGDPNDDTATPITDLVVGRTYVLKFSRTAGSAGRHDAGCPVEPDGPQRPQSRTGSADAAGQNPGAAAPDGGEHGSGARHQRGADRSGAWSENAQVTIL